MSKRIHPLIVIGLLFVIIIYLTIMNEFVNATEFDSEVLSEESVTESLIQNSLEESLGYSNEKSTPEDSFVETLLNESSVNDALEETSSTEDYLDNTFSQDDSLDNSVVDTSSENSNEEFESDVLPDNSEEEFESNVLLDNSTEEESTEWQGEILNATNGVVEGPSGKETYYNLDMSDVVSRMRSLGYDYEYYIRDDGVKMFGPYIMCAANLEVRPRGTIVETSLGTAIVCDTGGFAKKDPYHIDIAVNW